MRYIYGRNIFLHAVIGMGIIFFFNTSSIIYCAPGKDEKFMDMDEVQKCIDDFYKELESYEENYPKYKQGFQDPLNEMGILSPQLAIAIKVAEYNVEAKHLGDILKSYSNNDPENADSEIVTSFVPIYDVPKGGQPVPVDKVSKYISNNHNIPQTMAPIYDLPKGGQPVPVDKVSKYISNNHNMPQTTPNENINNNNLHSDQAKTRNKRSVQHNSEDEHHSNKDDYDVVDYHIDDDLSGNNINTHYLYEDYSYLYNDTTQHDNEYTVDGSAKLNDSNDEHIYEEIPLHKNEYTVDGSDKLNDSNDEHIYEEILLHKNEYTVDGSAKLNDSNDEYNSQAAQYNSEGTVHVQLRVDDKYLNRIYYDENDKYEEMDIQHNSEDAVDVPAKLNDSNDEHNSNQDDNYAEISSHNSEDAVDVPAKLNDSNDEHNSNQDDNYAEISSHNSEDTVDAPDDNTTPPDTNDTTASAINTDNNSTDHNDDKEWDDDPPHDNIIPDENNQLSNTYNQKRDITHEDHGIFLHLFNSANYTALYRISSRLTAYALDQTMDGQFASQKLVSSGSNMSNVQYEIWTMPLIKKGEKYIDSISKYTISTYGINVGLDSKIPHYCRGNIESIMGIVFALYNSKLKYTASDSATLLDTYIISMYYSIIFNQKFFIYTLFSFGTSNAGNYHSTLDVNNTTIYDPEPCNSYNAFRQSAELHAGYNIMVHDNKLHNRQVVFMPMAGAQIDTVVLHSDTNKHYSSVQQLKLSTGIKVVHHKIIKPSVSINSSLYGFVNYCTWSNTIMTCNDQPLISNFENGTLIEKDNLATSNNKLYYRIGGDASLQYNKVMYSFRYEMNIAQDYLSHQIALKIKLKL